MICIGAGIVLIAGSFLPANAEEASWYGDELAGAPMANGQPFNPAALTAAHKTLPLGSKVLVTRGDEEVEVTITDRGPFIPGRDIDLSRAAAAKLGINGVGAVDLERVNSPAPTTEAPEPPKENPSTLPATGGIEQ